MTVTTSPTNAVTHVSHFYARPADVAETIARVGLTDDARTRTSRLSGGRRPTAPTRHPTTSTPTPHPPHPPP